MLALMNRFDAASDEVAGMNAVTRTPAADHSEIWTRPPLTVC